MRYYILDRLQPIEKKILLEYILDKYIIDQMMVQLKNQI